MRRLILRSFQSPGDITVLTAAVRDLHLASPGQFQTDVRTSADALWANNPYLTQLSESEFGVESIDMQYPLIHQCNQRPYHFLHGYIQYLEESLKVRIPVTEFRGDIHLSPAERLSGPLNGHPFPDRYWIIVAGGKYDFTAKWWNPASCQKVVNHFLGRIQFVQVGESGHWHQPLDGVIDLIGKTSTREFVCLMYHAEGVVCPVTFAMHLAAAVETRPNRPKHRPCVVIAGGREPAQWEAYPHHQYISTNGMLSCCQEGGCWKSRCQTVGDGDSKDHHDLCEQPVELRPDLRIPRCMDMISADDVIRRIEMYYQGGALALFNGTTVSLPEVENGGNQETHPTDLIPVDGTIGRQLPGLAREISFSADGVLWCLGVEEFPLGNSIHRWNDDHWEQISGSAIRVSAGLNGEVWIIDRQNRIYSYADGYWEERPGRARELAVGPGGSIWSLDADDFAPGGGTIRYWIRDGWRTVEGAAVKIAVGPDGRSWILNSAGRVFRQIADGWELLPGIACELALGPDGSAWCLSAAKTADGEHSIHCWNGMDWDHVPGSAVKIAVGPNNRLLIVDHCQTIFERIFNPKSPSMTA